jgi:hypothetical protein
MSQEHLRSWGELLQAIGFRYVCGLCNDYGTDVWRDFIDHVVECRPDRPPASYRQPRTPDLDDMDDDAWWSGGGTRGGQNR